MSNLIEKIDMEIQGLSELEDLAVIEHNKVGLWGIRGRIEEAQRIKQFILSDQKETCEYVFVDDDRNVWECNQCGEPWMLSAGSPSDNNMHFCPKCGKPIQPSTGTEQLQK